MKKEIGERVEERVNHHKTNKPLLMKKKKKKMKKEKKQAKAKSDHTQKFTRYLAKSSKQCV